MQKILLAAAAVVTLAVPAISMAQPYGGYHEGWRDAPRYEAPRYEAPRYETSWRYEARREEALRELRWERQREWRAAHWRAEHRGYYGYRPY